MKQDYVNNYLEAIKNSLPELKDINFVDIGPVWIAITRTK